MKQVPYLLNVLSSLIAPPAGTHKSNYYKNLIYVVMLGCSQPLVSSSAVIILKQVLHGSNQQVALIQSGSMAGLLLSLFYTRYLATGIAQKDYALPQIFAWFTLVRCAFIQTSFVFSLLVFITLVLFYISMPSLSILYQKIYSPKIRGVVVGKIKQWQVLSTLLLSWLLGYLVETSPSFYPPVYCLVGILGLLASLSFLTIESSQENKEESENISFHNYLNILLQDKQFMLFLLFQFLLGMANIAGVAVFQVYANDKNYLALSPEKAALIVGVLPALAMFASVRLWGAIFDRIDIINFRILTSITMGLGFFIYPFYGIWGATIGTIVWGFGRGGGQLAWSIGILDFAPEGQAASYLSIHTFLTGIRGVIAPFLGIWLVDTYIIPAQLFWGVATLIFISAILTKSLVKVPGHRH
ncbi:MAG: MFS transporter [Spirochaetota bacterium]